MATIGGKFVNDSGVTEIDGAFVTNQPLNADTIGGVAINNTPTGAGEVLETVDPNNAHWTPAGGGGAVAVATVPLTNADIKGLGVVGTFVEAVAAQPGKILFPLAWRLEVDASTAAYSGIDPAAFLMVANWIDANNYNATTTFLAETPAGLVSQLLGGQAVKVAFGTLQPTLDTGFDYATVTSGNPSFENEPLVLIAPNGNPGTAYGDGDPANAGSLSVWYASVDAL